jgi:hypothetical protein
MLHSCLYPSVVVVTPAARPCCVIDLSCPAPPAHDESCPDTSAARQHMPDSPLASRLSAPAGAPTRSSSLRINKADDPPSFKPGYCMVPPTTLEALRSPRRMLLASAWPSSAIPRRIRSQSAAVTVPTAAARPVFEAMSARGFDMKPPGRVRCLTRRAAFVSQRL